MRGAAKKIYEKLAFVVMAVFVGPCCCGCLSPTASRGFSLQVNKITWPNNTHKQATHSSRNSHTYGRRSVNGNENVNFMSELGFFNAAVRPSSPPAIR